MKYVWPDREISLRFSRRSLHYLSMHASDHDLERYHLGMVTGAELDALEEHLIGCGKCAERAAEAADYVDAMRSGIIVGDFDLEAPGDMRLSKPNK